ncbi:hypothetical protein D3C86_1885810 [compost metagenome]
MMGKIGYVNPISSCIQHLQEKGFELNDLMAVGNTKVDIADMQKMIDGAIYFLMAHEKLGDGFSGYDKNGNPTFTKQEGIGEVN